MKKELSIFCLFTALVFAVVAFLFQMFDGSAAANKAIITWLWLAIMSLTASILIKSKWKKIK